MPFGSSVNPVHPAMERTSPTRKPLGSDFNDVQSLSKSSSTNKSLGNSVRPVQPINSIKYSSPSGLLSSLIFGGSLVSPIQPDKSSIPRIFKFGGNSTRLGQFVNWRCQTSKSGGIERRLMQ